MPKSGIEPNAGSLERMKETALRAAFISPASCKVGNILTEQPLPTLERSIKREASAGDCASRDQPFPQGELLLESSKMAEELTRCRGLQEVTSWLSIGGIGRIHPPNEGNSCQPGVVEFGRRLVNVAGTAEAPDRGNTIRFPIIMPAIGAPDDEIKPKFVSKLVFPAPVSELRCKVRAFAEETNVFKAVQPGRIPWQQVGMR